MYGTPKPRIWRRTDVRGRWFHFLQMPDLSFLLCVARSGRDRLEHWVKLGAFLGRAWVEFKLAHFFAEMPTTANT